MRPKTILPPILLVGRGTAVNNKGCTVRESAGDMANGMSYYISGLYETPKKEILFVGLQVHRLPSFCGGVFLHSPVVRVTPMRGTWGYSVPRIMDRDALKEYACGDGERPEWLINIEPYMKASESVSAFGWRVLANAVYELLANLSRRSAVITGPKSDGEITRLIDSLADVRYVCNSAYMVGDVPYSRTVVATHSPQLVRTYRGAFHISRGPLFENPNSGRDCRYTQITLTHAGDLEDYSPDRTWGDRSSFPMRIAQKAYESAKAGGKKVGDFDGWALDKYNGYPLTENEVAYLSNCGAHVVREYWQR